MNKYRKFVQGLFSHTPYEIRKRKPPITLNPIKLLLAYYCALDRQATVVQIGACDGSASDPLTEFLRTGKLRAVLLEPIPRSYERLKNTYAEIPGITTVQAAIAAQDGEMVMYNIKPVGRWANSDWAPQVSSFDKRHILKHGIDARDIQETKVTALSLQSLIAQYNFEAIDLLQIDAEGYDAEIVKMALNLTFQPKALNFETTHTPYSTLIKLFELLQRNGYSLIYDAGNALAVKQTLQAEFVGKILT